MQGGYEAATRGVRQVGGSYKGYKAGTRLLQVAQGRYEAAIRGCKAGMRQLQGVQGGMRQQQ